MIPKIKRTETLPRRERRSGREKRRRLHTWHINARIEKIIATIVTSMVTPKKSVGIYIQR